jgi:stearoyl-CoA desaturase (delta-9 desaturase)
VLGSLAIEGNVIIWVSDHRKHHQFSDKPGDPHSPHLDEHTGIRGILRGLGHAHVGWMFSNVGRADQDRYAPDLVEDSKLRVIAQLFPLYVAASLAIPFAVGYLITERSSAALRRCSGRLVRIFLLHHVTFSINSVCHGGRRRFKVMTSRGTTSSSRSSPSGILAPQPPRLTSAYHGLAGRSTSPACSSAVSRRSGSRGT